MSEELPETLELVQVLSDEVSETQDELLKTMPEGISLVSRNRISTMIEAAYLKAYKRGFLAGSRDQAETPEAPDGFDFDELVEATCDIKAQPNHPEVLCAEGTKLRITGIEFNDLHPIGVRIDDDPECAFAVSRKEIRKVPNNQ